MYSFSFRYVYFVVFMRLGLWLILCCYYIQTFEMAAYLSVYTYYHPHHFILIHRNFHSSLSRQLCAKHVDQISDLESTTYREGIFAMRQLVKTANSRVTELSRANKSLRQLIAP